MADNKSGAAFCDCCGKALNGYYEYSGRVCYECLYELTKTDISPCAICGKERDWGGKMPEHRYRGRNVHMSCLCGKLYRENDTKG